MGNIELQNEYEQKLFNILGVPEKLLISNGIENQLRQFDDNFVKPMLTGIQRNPQSALLFLLGQQ